MALPHIPLDTLNDIAKNASEVITREIEGTVLALQTALDTLKKTNIDEKVRSKLRDTYGHIIKLN